MIWVAICIILSVSVTHFADFAHFTNVIIKNKNVLLVTFLSNFKTIAKHN
jgi:hypothetical protein